MTQKKIRILKIIYLSGIFLAMFIFFTQIHPLVIFDTDDWSYISARRHMLPIWGIWNPTRVFPEVFMPLCGDIAGFLVYPLTGDYIRSFTLVNGAVVALFIVLYMDMLFELLYRKWELPAFRAFLLSTLFLIFHFFVFRDNDIVTGNEYLFLAPNVTCYYYYVIPALLNCSLVLYLMRNDVLYDGWRKLKAGTFSNHIARNSILFLAFYFALFSNLFQSVILAAFIGCQLLFELIGFVRAKGNFAEFKELVKTNFLRLIFISAWIIEQIFEVNGGRSTSLSSGKTVSFLQSVISALQSILNKARSMNKLFLLGIIGVFLLAIVIGVYCYVKKGTEEKKYLEGNMRQIAIMSVSEILIVAYLILLFSRANYAGRADVWISLLFFAFLAVVFCGSYIIDKIRFLDLLLPFVCCFLVFETRTMTRTFADTKVGGIDNSTCVAIDNDIVSQFIAADRARESEVVLYVPEFPANDNWPLATYAAHRFPETLYRHGVIDRLITVTEMVPTREKNEQFNLD